VIYPDLIRRFVRDGGGYCSTITNDAWCGRTSAAYQHWDQASMRAIEEGRYLARGQHRDQRIRRPVRPHHLEDAALRAGHCVRTSVSSPTARFTAGLVTWWRGCRWRSLVAFLSAWNFDRLVSIPGPPLGLHALSRAASTAPPIAWLTRRLARTLE
jgi:hypothetical protein